MCKCGELEVFFSKINDDAIIPSKRDCDMGWDIYANFEQDFIAIHPNSIELIGTGIATAFNTSWGAIIKERGSTGVRGMAVRAGVIEGSYRNEWFVPINNTSNNTIIIAKDEQFIRKEIEGGKIYVDGICQIYPYEKAIAQFVLIPVPKIKKNVIKYDELKLISSDRGLGNLGSSGK